MSDAPTQADESDVPVNAVEIPSAPSDTGGR